MMDRTSIAFLVGSFICVTPAMSAKDGVKPLIVDASQTDQSECIEGANAPRAGNHGSVFLVTAENCPACDRFHEKGVYDLYGSSGSGAGVLAPNKSYVLHFPRVKAGRNMLDLMQDPEGCFAALEGVAGKINEFPTVLYADENGNWQAAPMVQDSNGNLVLSPQSLKKMAALGIHGVGESKDAVEKDSGREGSPSVPVYDESNHTAYPNKSGSHGSGSSR